MTATKLVQTLIQQTVKYQNLFTTLPARIKFINVYVFSKFYYFLQILKFPLGMLAQIKKYKDILYSLFFLTESIELFFIILILKVDSNLKMLNYEAWHCLSIVH